MVVKLQLKRKKASGEVRNLIASGDEARGRQEWATAASAYHSALQVQPGLSAIWIQYGNMLKEDRILKGDRQFEDAEAAYLEALRLVPDDADAHLQYGHLLKLSGRLDEAAAYFHRSALLDPARPDARGELDSLAERGTSRAQIQLPPRDSKPHTWSLNAKLAATRMQIAEVLAEIKKIERRSPGALSSQDDGYLRTLNAAYESIAPLMRSLNPVRTRAAIGDVPADLTLKSGEPISVVFDTSDLIQFFRHHRLPTGIQRVQAEAIYAALIKADPAFDVKVCCFTEADDYWCEVPHPDFMNLCELSLIHSDWSAPDWRAAMSDLEVKLRGSANFVFSKGAYLVNMGTSWWLQNYFLYIREAKIREQIKYVPFVHDMIPIMTPEHCVAGLTQDFISWALGVFRHADHYLVNSEATRRDLQKVGATLGYEVTDDRIHAIRLDADFRKGQHVPFDPSVLLTHRLRRDGYVLFVSTIESRKNHLAAFNAWMRICKDHRAENVPKLVCVGMRGWLNEPVYAKLESSVELREKVVMLQGVPDRDLAILYQNCLFTLFPSSYEGWGLPVTESLCYGKVPVASNSSSLPEAGGEFADYFDLGDENQLVEALERLMFDAEYRRARETLIRQKYRPRSWEDVSDDIFGALEKWGRTAVTIAEDQALVPTVTLARYYPISRNTDIKIYRSMSSGEIFRTGDAWWGCDDWGCWTKPAPARLAMRVTEGEGRYRLYLGLHSVPEKDTPYDVMVSGCAMVRGVIKNSKSKWLSFDLDLTDGTDPVVQIVLQGYETGSSRPRPEEEPRTVALGVIGFMLCRQDDAVARTNFIEAVALDNLDQLARVVPDDSR
jgi:glycosyltransferase involved in cell wall biosynthesis